MVVVVQKQRRTVFISQLNACAGAVDELPQPCDIEQREEKRLSTRGARAATTTGTAALLGEEATAIRVTGATRLTRDIPKSSIHVAEQAFAERARIQAQGLASWEAEAVGDARLTTQAEATAGAVVLAGAVDVRLQRLKL